ncbi:MAG: hypothetical protein AAF499_02725 [Pseudomonadota bacterium]
MSSQSHAQLSSLTTILPNAVANRVLESVIAEAGFPTFCSNARGTLLHDHWFKRMFPPISPVKTLVEMIIPSDKVDTATAAIVRESRLDQQAVGAIYSIDYDQAWMSADSPVHIAQESQQNTGRVAESAQKLRIVFCVVGHAQSEKIAKAAIEHGAHGPIISYAEGRGLRDRLGWLRITKDHEQEVMTILADEEDVDDLIDVLAKAGEFHLPGRGFMYSLPISKGLFNIPSRIAGHHHAASMQQVIHAIDQLSGHTNWRDQDIFDVGFNGRSSGIKSLARQSSYQRNRHCLSLIATRSDLQRVTDILLDLGAPGLNISFIRHAHQTSETAIGDEWVKLQSVLDADLAQRIYDEIACNAEDNGLRKVFIGTTPVPLVASYVPGKKDYRKPRAAA